MSESADSGQNVDLNNASQFSGSSISGDEGPSINLQLRQNVLGSSLVDVVEEEQVPPLQHQKSPIVENLDEEADESLYSDDEPSILKRAKVERHMPSDESSDMPVEEDECDCQPKILIVDDTSFNILAVQCMLQENF